LKDHKIQNKNKTKKKKKKEKYPHNLPAIRLFNVPGKRQSWFMIQITDKSWQQGKWNKKCYFIWGKWEKKHVFVILLRAAQLPVRNGDIYNQPYEEK